MTTGGDVTIFRAPTLTGLAGGDRATVWTAADCGPGWKELWAPELHRLDGRWFIYFTATRGGDADRRLLVLECAAEDPLQGIWKSRGRIGPDAYAIDATVATVGDRRWLLWSGRDPATGDDQHLFIAPLTSPTKAGRPVKLASPTLAWERAGRPILEGPQVVVRGDTVNLLYAASASWTDDYCLGLMTAKTGADLADPAAWTKRREPLVASTEAVRGPGHGCVVGSPDGRESWLVLHAARWPGSGWTRHVLARPIGFDAQGALLPVAPPAVDAPLRLPSGEPGRLRIEAEAGKLSGLARVVDCGNASGGKKVGFLDTPDSAVELTAQVPRAGTWLIAVRAGNGTREEVVAYHRLWVNGAETADIPVVRSGWERWSVNCAKVQLKEGKNTLRLAHRQAYAELDVVDLIPVE